MIGINSVKIASSETEGLGFAIPSNVAVPIIRMMTNGYVTGRASIRSPAKRSAAVWHPYYGVPQGFWSAPLPPAPALSKNGLKAGDIITAFNGRGSHQLR